MSTTVTVHPHHLERLAPSEVLRVEPWGSDAVRVRAGAAGIRRTAPGALDDQPPGTAPGAPAAHTETTGDGGARLVNGRITAHLDARGRLRFTHTATGEELLADAEPYKGWPPPRTHTPHGDGGYRLEQRFAAHPGERLYGLGQHLHGRLDQKGLVIELAQRNAEVSIPLLISSRGYGLLWNNPALGRVELAHDATRWVAERSEQIDYWITAGDTPADLMAAYAAATGHPPPLPYWATGFWQSRLRYRSQEELLAVAREFARRELPLSVIVSDFFHWRQMGDWSFDPADWPDPAAMVAELEALGVRLMVSVWPTVHPDSTHYPALRATGGLVADRHGGVITQNWPAPGGFAPTHYYDPTDPDARRLLWDAVREGYHRHGVRVFWLDADEPDLAPPLQERAQYAAGDGRRVGNLYPREHARAFHEGLTAEGEQEILTLNRSAWAGSQRYGAALWSGDIPATFDSLRTQIRAGLNVALSGIPWWTTDIGGFHGGDPADPAYQELMVRWFQYGVHCPLFRLHGDRDPNEPFGVTMTGGPNEPWSYGPAYPLIREQLLLRERLRPYVQEQMDIAHRTGTPPMRPLFYDAPDDPAAWEVEDQFLLGPDLLVAPVAGPGVRERPVYLPAGSRWQDAHDGTWHEGGGTVRAAAPLERIPLYVRAGRTLPIRPADG
ncbi:family 31 glucosidase [Streptomyces carpaticus]|uniref:glycoside hydrolase family 31 protein n=1 Tax=Streptomyces carpaticus TaxID=285558 RepID=UPI0021F94F40|nr:family 31 glucosidase [Streptomyces carpaticus]